MSSDKTDATENRGESNGDEAMIAATVARVEHMFADCADEPLMQELRRLALARAEQGAIR